MHRSTPSSRLIGQGQGFMRAQISMILFQTISLYKSTNFKKEEEEGETVGLHIIFVTRKTLTRKWLHMGIEVENQIMYLHLLI